MKKTILFVIFLFTLLIAGRVNAGGGRVQPIVLDQYGISRSKPVRVEAIISKEDYSGPSVGENAEIRLVNARPGDYCRTFNNITDQEGKIKGECGSDQAGGLTMYIHTYKDNRDSYTVFFQIHEPVESPAPAKTSPAATKQPEASPLPTPAPVASSPESKAVESMKINYGLYTGLALFILIISTALIFLLCRPVKKAIKIFALIAYLIIVGLTVILLIRKQNKISVAPTSAPVAPGPGPSLNPSPSISPPPAAVKPATITVTIKGFVYNDENCNFKFDPGESPLPNVQVNIFRYLDGKIINISNKTYGDDGKYSYSFTIQPKETAVVLPSPYRIGYSIIAMSGLPQQVHLSAGAKVVTQDFPMLKSSETERCFK
jgi:hypothetical protein